MSLPQDIPDDLARRAVPVGGLGPGGGEIAWTGEDALEVIESLRGTKVAVIAGDVYRSERWGLIPTDNSWTCSVLPGETASDYADRSRRLARSRVEAHGEADARALYAFSFSRQQEAA